MLNVKEVIKEGVFAYPTETVFGLGCNPKCITALNKINTIKNRKAKGFIIVASKISYLQEYVDIDLSKVSMLKNRTRATTIIVPCKVQYQGVLTGGKETIAIRYSLHPMVGKLCNALKGAIVSTSLNQSGESPIDSSKIAIEQYRNKLDLVLEGECGRQQPSQIIEYLSNKVLRD